MIKNWLISSILKKILYSGVGCVYSYHSTLLERLRILIIRLHQMLHWCICPMQECVEQGISFLLKPSQLSFHQFLIYGSIVWWRYNICEICEYFRRYADGVVDVWNW